MRKTAVFPGSVNYEVPHPSRWSKFLFGLGISAADVLRLGIARPRSVVGSRLLRERDYDVTLAAATPRDAPPATPLCLLVGTVLQHRTEVPTKMSLDSLEVVS